MARPRNLLLCFDAFGTLFKPRYPIAQQYGDVARSFGLSGFTNDDVAVCFKQAFKKESRENPNYGKATGGNAERWWGNIIKNTFQPLLPSGEDGIPEGMTKKLLHRFWSDEGYTLYPDVLPFSRKIRAVHREEGTKVVVGIITNSDDRVPDILKALGASVSPLRVGCFHENVVPAKGEEYDLEFTVLSYDVGVEKPDKRIFDAAEGLVGPVLEGLESGGEDVDISEWRRVYVGDEYEKDVVGALHAGWNAVLIDRETPGKEKEVEWLDEKPKGNLFEVFETANAVSSSSLGKLSEWLPGKPQRF